MRYARPYLENGWVVRLSCYLFNNIPYNRRTTDYLSDKMPDAEEMNP
jgi:hypothetical protein